MSRFNPQQVFEKISSTSLLPLFNHADFEICREVVSVCYRAGIRAFELTNRDEKAFDVFKALQSWVGLHCPELSLGVGTILDKQSAEIFIQAGADFVIAPVFDFETSLHCKNRNIPYIPGCFTPTEMQHAYVAGSPVVKLFPAETVGAAYLKHIKGPLPDIKTIVTGGVGFGKEEIERWISAGVLALGMGSSVFTKKRIQDRDFSSMEKEILQIISIIKGLKL